MIAVIDYGMGNLRSVQKALQRVGADARVVSTPAEVAVAEKILLPGVGAFQDAMGRLGDQELIEPLRSAIEQGRPFLGICLGLQLLFDVSYEDGEHTGLGVVSGRVERFDFSGLAGGERLRVPHMGWNRIAPRDEDNPLLRGLETGTSTYFAHSYHVVPADDAVVAATTDYGQPFVSAIRQGNLFGTQFHPEKSQAVGLKMLENFVKL
jgi:glutamine amidotransferase